MTGALRSVTHVLAAIALLSIGCGILPDTARLSRSGSDAGTGAGASGDDDTADTSDAGAGGGGNLFGGGGQDAAVPSNLVQGGDFEDGEGCAGFKAFNGTVSAASESAHSGSRSCRVCAPAETGTNKVFSIESSAAVPCGAGDVLRGEAWVKAGDKPLEVHVNVRPQDDKDQLDTITSPGVTTTNEWTRVEVTATVTKRGYRKPNSCDFYIHSDATVSGACFLVDDLALYRVSK